MQRATNPPLILAAIADGVKTNVLMSYPGGVNGGGGGYAGGGDGADK